MPHQQSEKLMGPRRLAIVPIGWRGQAPSGYSQPLAWLPSSLMPGKASVESLGGDCRLHGGMGTSPHRMG